MRTIEGSVSGVCGHTKQVIPNTSRVLSHNVLHLPGARDCASQALLAFGSFELDVHQTQSSKVPKALRTSARTLPLNLASLLSQALWASMSISLTVRDQQTTCMNSQPVLQNLCGTDETRLSLTQDMYAHGSHKQILQSQDVQAVHFTEIS